MAPVPNQFANETTPLALVKLDENFAAFQGATGSSLVGFNNGSTGAVTRPAQEKMRETISVKDFGAVGDGVVDDTVSIQTAINRAAAIGGRAVFENGNYICGPLTVSASLTSVGHTATLTRRLGSTGAWLNITANEIEISGFRLQGNYIPHRCFEVDGRGGVTIKDNYVRQIGEYFVHFNGADRLTVSGNDYADSSNGITNLMPGDVTGVVSNYVRIVGNRFNNFPGTAIHFAGNQVTGLPNNGILSPLTRYSSIANNIISNVAGSGIICQSWDVSVAGNVLFNIGTAGGNQGIVSQGRNVTVSGNVLRTGTGVGIDMGACTFSSVTGNIVEGFAQIGIELNSCIGTVVTGNSVAGCGYGLSTDQSAGIVVDEGFFGGAFVNFNTVVSGNTVSSGSTPGRYGISILAGISETIVTGNIVVSSGSVGPIFLSTTATALIYGNQENASEPAALVLLGANPEIKFRSNATDTDAIIATGGAGVVRFGTFTSSSDVPVTGSIVIRDAGGTLRKLAVVA